VGAGLLAKASAHSTSLSPDASLSRASHAPTVFCGEAHIPIHTEIPWERACPRRRRHIQHLCRLTHRFRGQATLPQCFVVRHISRSIPRSLWERACPRRRLHIQHLCRLTHRFRGQATLPHCFVVRHISRSIPRSLWERACPRRRRHCHPRNSLTHQQIPPTKKGTFVPLRYRLACHQPINKYPSTTM